LAAVDFVAVDFAGVDLLAVDLLAGRDVDLLAGRDVDLLAGREADLLAARVVVDLVAGAFLATVRPAGALLAADFFVGAFAVVLRDETVFLAADLAAGRTADLVLLALAADLAAGLAVDLVTGRLAAVEVAATTGLAVLRLVVARAGAGLTVPAGVPETGLFLVLKAFCAAAMVVFLLANDCGLSPRGDREVPAWTKESAPA
jgi:hypothetical protein